MVTFLLLACEPKIHVTSPIDGDVFEGVPAPGGDRSGLLTVSIPVRIEPIRVTEVDLSVTGPSSYTELHWPEEDEVFHEVEARAGVYVLPIIWSETGRNGASEGWAITRTITLVAEGDVQWDD